MDKSLSGIAHDHYEEERVVGYDVQYQYNGRFAMPGESGTPASARASRSMSRRRAVDPGRGAGEFCEAAPD